MVDGEEERGFVAAVDDGSVLGDVVGFPGIRVARGVVGFVSKTKDEFFIVFRLSVDASHGAHLDDGAFVGGGKDVDVDRHALDIEGEDAKGCVGSLFGTGGDVGDVDRTFEGASSFLLAESADGGVADVEPAAADDVLVDEESDDGFDGGFVELASVADRVAFFGLFLEPPGAVRHEERMFDFDLDKGLFVWVVPNDGASIHDGAFFDDAFDLGCDRGDARFEPRRKATVVFVGTLGEFAAAAVAAASSVGVGFQSVGERFVHIVAQRFDGASIPSTFAIVRDEHVKKGGHSRHVEADVASAGQPSEDPIHRLDGVPTDRVVQLGFETLHRKLGGDLGSLACENCVFKGCRQVVDVGDTPLGCPFLDARLDGLTAERTDHLRILDRRRGGVQISNRCRTEQIDNLVAKNRVVLVVGFGEACGSECREAGLGIREHAVGRVVEFTLILNIDVFDTILLLEAVNLC